MFNFAGPRLGFLRTQLRPLRERSLLEHFLRKNATDEYMEDIRLNYFPTKNLSGRNIIPQPVTTVISIVLLNFPSHFSPFLSCIKQGLLGD